MDGSLELGHFPLFFLFSFFFFFPLGTGEALSLSREGGSCFLWSFGSWGGRHRRCRHLTAKARAVLFKRVFVIYGLLLFIFGYLSSFSEQPYTKAHGINSTKSLIFANFKSMP